MWGGVFGNNQGCSYDEKSFRKHLRKSSATNRSGQVGVELSARGNHQQGHTTLAKTTTSSAGSILGRANTTPGPMAPAD